MDIEKRTRLRRCVEDIECLEERSILNANSIILNANSIILNANSIIVNAKFHHFYLQDTGAQHGEVEIVRVMHVRQLLLLQHSSFEIHIPSF